MDGSSRPPAGFGDRRHELEAAMQTDEVRRAVSMLPDGDAAARVLNARLAELRVSLRGSMLDGWRVVAEPEAYGSSTAAGLLTLARLIELDGWNRLRVCCRDECREVFVDLTNAARRKYCDAHKRAT